MQFMQKQSGVTLIELTVVLLILVALAGLAIPYMSGTSSAALCKATDITMQNVKKVIMERYYLDTLGYFPKDTKDAVANYNLRYLFTKPTDWNLFDPATQTGWRGNYLQGGITLGSGQYIAGNLDVSFRDTNTIPPTATPHVNADVANTDTVILDGWGRPLIIQVDTTNPNAFVAKLVSAGAGNGLGIGDASIETQINGGRQPGSDDRILYLNAATPTADINPSCDE
jgi:prepilin-type N-terminal cleavage/methylation domain-containing protein